MGRLLVIDEVQQGVDAGDREAAAEVAGGGGIRDAASTQGVEGRRISIKAAIENMTRRALTRSRLAFPEIAGIANA